MGKDGRGMRRHDCYMENSCSYRHCSTDFPYELQTQSERIAKL